MPLFNQRKPGSDEIAWAVELGKRLGECQAWKNITGKLTADIDSTIYLGPGPLPSDADEFTPEELASLHAYAQIRPETEDGQTVSVGDGAEDDPTEQSIFVISTRRFVADSELKGYEWGDVYNWFWQEASALTKELFKKSRQAGCPLVQSITRTACGFVNFKQTTGQGVALFADYVVEIGDGNE